MGREPSKRDPGRADSLRSAGWLESSLDHRHQSAALALQPSGEFELQEHGAHDGGRCTTQPDQIVDLDRARAEQVDDALAFAGFWIAFQRIAVILAQR